MSMALGITSLQKLKYDIHIKFNFGMIPVAIWFEYRTSVFAVLELLLKSGNQVEILES